MAFKLLTEREVAQLLRLSVRSVQRLRREGHLPYQPGPPHRYLEEDIERYVRRKMIAAAPQPTPLAMRSRKDLTIKERARRMAAEVLAKGDNPNWFRTGRKPKRKTD